ncbi:MAG: outer membrane lipoprotein carrier protein LolA [Lysinibacillus sp.]
MKKIIYSATLVLTLMLGACSTTQEFTPQEILNNAMQETEDLNSYYAEYKTELDDGTSMTAKQWSKNGKARVEITDDNGETSIAVNDGKQIISYTSTEQKATAFNLNGETDAMMQPTLKEQMENIYNLIKDTHEITYGDDATIAGHDTYHLIAKSKEKDTLFGDMEFWIDKKTWMPLKTITVSGGVNSTTEYTKYEPNAKVDDTVFKFELPEGVELVHEEIDLPTNITLEEAKEMLGDLLILAESTGYTIDTIEDMHTDTNEININYVKDDVLQFSISVFAPEEPLTDIENPITVRGFDGGTDDLGFRFLQWDENGLRYNVLFKNEEPSYDDFVKLAEQMEVVK